MIAAVGHSLLERGARDGLDLETYARGPLTQKLWTQDSPPMARPA
jgi:hypothetical protein